MLKTAATVLVLAATLAAQQSADQLFQQAARHQQAGRWTEAEQAYRTYLKRFGATPEALANLGAVLVRLERFDEAIAAYSQALKLAPDLLPIRLNLGLAWFKSGDPVRAVAEFSHVLEKQPPNRQVRQLRAMALLELERFEEAASDLTVLMPTDDLSVRLALASAYIRLRRTDEARSILDPLLDSDAAEVKLVLGQMLLADGRVDDARAALERAAQLNPRLPTLRLNLGAVYWRQRDTEAAVAEWRRELAANPRSFQANFTLGAALALSRSNTAEAEKLLRAALAQRPKSAQALYHLAKLVWLRDKSAEAVSLLERSTQSDANYREAHYLLANIYQTLGRRQEAAREFAEVKRITQEDLQRAQDIFESGR